jgi:tetratricopeptide (TPR) repeat protein
MSGLLIKLKSLKGSVTLHLILITLLGLVAYSNTFQAPFVFDDGMYIEKNPLTNDFHYLFQPSDSDILRLEETVKLTRKTRSMAYLSFFLNYKLHGLMVSGYHATNLLIHLLNSFLVYFLVKLTLERTPFLRKSSLKEHSGYIALFTGLLFVAHPVQTQAVTYICQRFSSLAAFFYLLSVLAYVRSRVSKGDIKRYTFYSLSLISAVLAMKTKENSFTLPMAIVLYELMFLEGPRKRRFFYLFPLLLTMLIVPLSVIDFDRPFGEAVAGATRTHTEISRHDYFVTQFRVVVTYLRLLVFPVNQNLDYDYPIFHSFFNLQVFSSFLFLLLLFSFSVFLCYRSRKSESGLRLIAFGGLWFFMALSVESSLVPIADVIFEHRLYLPSIGAFIALGTGAFLLLERFKKEAMRKAFVSFLVVIPLALSAATYSRNTVWINKISLWEDVVKKSPAKARGHNNLGNTYADNGFYDKAIEHYEKAISLKPDYAEAYNNLGNAYKNKGLTDKALEHFRTAIKLEHYYAEAHKNLGITYGAKGLTDKAIEHFRIALKMKPDYTEAHLNLGVAYGRKGLTDKAIEHLETTVRLKPDNEKAHLNLGAVYGLKGLTDKAIEHFKMALTLESDDADIYFNLGIAYGRQGLIDKAIEHFQAAVRLKPNFTRAHHNLGLAYLKKGLAENARKEFGTVLKISPNHTEAQRFLNNISTSKD